MLRTYFNYSTRSAQDLFGRRAFVRAWWRIYQDDRQWVPPYYPGLFRHLVGRKARHLARLNAVLMHLEALPRRNPIQKRTGPLVTEWSAVLETPVAAGLLWQDARVARRTAFLGLWRTVNDDDTCERFLEEALAQMAQIGVRQLLGPVHLSPALGYGFLADCWDQSAALDMPYSPPYQAELVGRHMEVVAEDRVWHWPVPAEAHAGRTAFTDVDPARLIHDLWPLWEAAPPANTLLPPLDLIEAAFLLSWWRPFPLHARVLLEAEEPVGFALLQPDLGPALRRARGGRTLTGRLRWQVARRRPAIRGRLLALGIARGTDVPDVEARLLLEAGRFARDHGWESLVTGPLPAWHPVARLLAAHGAEPRETVQLFALDAG